MANRHLARSLVLQTLFEWDFNNKSDVDALKIMERNCLEFAPGLDDSVFTNNLLKMILAKKADIDLIIQKAAPDWPLDKISIVDRNILRIGLSELLFSDKKEVPAKVAINESIELAKNFGGENSGRFINGVLGAVYREMGEPGKDDQPTKKKPKEVPFEEMEIERLGGAIVYSVFEGQTYLAFVHDVFGHWTLSKGRIEKDENEMEATKREIKEEMGIDVEIEEKVGFNEYVASHPEKGKYRKQVSYYLAKAQYTPLILGTSGGLDDAKWFPINEIVDLNFYNDIVPIVTKAVKILLEKHKE